MRAREAFVFLGRSVDGEGAPFVAAAAAFFIGPLFVWLVIDETYHGVRWLVRKAFAHD